MVITIKNDDSRFGVRVAGIIFNHDRTKIFMQKQEKHDFYMFPGGRLEVHEDIETAIKRELEEELAMKEEVTLKYLAESFIQFPNKRYHELGYYFVLAIDEKKYGYELEKQYHSLDEENDGKSLFEWIDLDQIQSINIMPNFMKDKITNIASDKLEHIIYREYE